VVIDRHVWDGWGREMVKLIVIRIVMKEEKSYKKEGGREGGGCRGIKSMGR
jgi:hypothetical protein